MDLNTLLEPLAPVASLLGIPLWGVPVLILSAAFFLIISGVLLSRWRKLRLLPPGFRTGSNLRKLRQAYKAQKDNRPADAAKLFAACGLHEDAIRLFKQTRNFKGLAELHLDNDEELLAAAAYAKAGLAKKAADLYLKANKPLEAATLFRRAGNLRDAADCFAKGMRFADAAPLYEESGAGAEALACYQRIKDAGGYAGASARWLEKLIRTHHGQVPSDLLAQIDMDAALLGAENSGLWSELFSLASFNLTWDKAALAAERKGEIDLAIELYRRAEELEQSGRLLEESGRPQEAELDYAQHYERCQEWAEAASHYQAAGNYERAVDLLKQAGMKQEAAEMYFNQGQYIEAGELFAEMAIYDSAGQAYLLAGKKELAADNLALAGQKERAASLYMEVEHYADAGNLYLELDQADAGVSALQKHLRMNPDDVNIAVRIAELLEDRGLLTSAAETYNNLIAGRPVNDKNIDYYYKLARVTERLNTPAKAKLIYEKILAFDLNHLDVPDRISNLARQEMVADLGGSRNEGHRSGKQRYQIIKEIGQGGMGTVFLADDTTLDRKVALKVLNTSALGADAVDRLMEEARISAGLLHQNIVTVFDVSLIDASLYLSMEYVEGDTVRDLIADSGPLPLTPFLLLFGQACQGLAYAHGRNIVHRDIKPANLMWTPDRKLKVMDFGLACAIQELANTQTVVVGTPHYMAPEQVMGNRVDARADIYSLGVTMYEATVGERPFSGSDVGYHHIHTAPPDPSELRSSLPAELAKLIMKCMAKKPEDRFQTVDEMFTELKAIMQKISRG